MKTCLALSHFAAQTHPTSPWPTGAIVVPAGSVRVQASERLLVHSGHVIGVVLSEEAAMLCLARQRSRDDLVLLEQVTGFLHAYGFYVVRLRIRFPLRWVLRGGWAPSFLWRKCVIHWARVFLADRSRACQLTLPPNVLVPAAIRDSLRAGAGLWRDTLAILVGLEHADPELLLNLASELTKVARWWEFHVVGMMRRAELEGWFSREDRDLVAESDRYWKLCVQFLPAYEMLPHTVARLL